MSTELINKTLENLPEDIRNEIQNDAKNYSKEKMNFPPSVGISMEDESIGTFFLDYMKDGEKVRELIGKELEMVILKEKKSFSWYDDKSKKLELFSNEMAVTGGGVSKYEPVALKDSDSQIIWAGRYEKFLEEKKTRWLMPLETGAMYQKSLLKQQTVLYVWLVQQKKLARLFVRLSSSVGVDPAGGYLFKNPAEGSLERLKDSKKGLAPYVYSVILTNKKGEGSLPWRKMLFNFGKDLNETEIVEMYNLKKEVEKFNDLMNSTFGITQGMIEHDDNPFNKPEVGTPTASYNLSGPSKELPTINVDDDLELPPLEEPVDEIRIEDIPF